MVGKNLFYEDRCLNLGEHPTGKGGLVQEYIAAKLTNGRRPLRLGPPGLRVVASCHTTLAIGLQLHGMLQMPFKR